MNKISSIAECTQGAKRCWVFNLRNEINFDLHGALSLYSQERKKTRMNSGVQEDELRPQHGLVQCVYKRTHLSGISQYLVFRITVGKNSHPFPGSHGTGTGGKASSPW